MRVVRAVRLYGLCGPLYGLWAPIGRRAACLHPLDCTKLGARPIVLARPLVRGPPHQPDAARRHTALPS